MRKALSVGVIVLWSAPAFAASPSLPRVLMDTEYRTPTGSITPVASGANLQTAINAASCGDVLELEAGATWTGNYTLPDKNCSDSTYVIIRTATPDGAFPRPGTRVGPANAGLMAKLTSGTNEILVTASGADHYRLIGIEITPTVWISNLVDLGTGQGDLGTEANHIIFDRCYIHGHATEGSNRGIAANGAYIAVIDSYFSDIKTVGQQSQAICAWNGSGPFKIVNNYLEAAGENVMFGGADSTSLDFVPSDIEIRRNHFYKPLQWKVGDPLYEGTHWSIVNSFELKAARWILIENNFFDQTWGDVQQKAINIGPKNQSGTAPWSTVEDVTFRGNWIRRAPHAIEIGGSDYEQTSDSIKRMEMSHNLFTEIDSGVFTSDAPHTIVSSSARPAPPDAPFDDWIFTHNTSAGTAAVFAQLMIGEDYRRFVHNYTIYSSGSFRADQHDTGTIALEYCCAGYTFISNVFTGMNCSDYPNGTSCPATTGDIGFENFAGGDYRLATSSSYDTVGDGGSDLGAWIPAATAAASQLDWSVEVEPAYTGARVTFGVPGLPYNQSCTVRYGASSTTSSAGPSRRTVILSGLTPTQEYFVGIDCGTTWGGWLSWDNYTATTNPGGTKTVPFSIKPPATLSTVARAKVECSTSSDMSDPVSAQDTSCTSAAVCEIDVASVPVGLNYCRHIYQTSGDVAVATSAVQPISVQ